MSVPDSPRSLPIASKKRKHSSNDAPKPSVAVISSEASERPPKSSKKKKQKRRHRSTSPGHDNELGINTVFATLPPQNISDLLLRQLKRFAPSLTPIELDERAVSSRHISHTTSFTNDRIDAHLPEFLEAYSAARPSGKKKPPNGSPTTIVISPAAVRAVDVIRVLRPSTKLPIGKLFSKHLALQAQISFMSSTSMDIGVGTPARLSQLVESGALKLDRLLAVVVDASYVDAKKRGIVDMAETLVPLVDFLSLEGIRAKLDAEDKPAKVLFY
jgi:protein CMS1